MDEEYKQSKGFGDDNFENKDGLKGSEGGLWKVFEIWNLLMWRRKSED